MRLTELNCWAVPLTAVGRGGGPRGAAHPSDSCWVNFVKISADLESQLGFLDQESSSISRQANGRYTLHPGSAPRRRLSAVSSTGQPLDPACEVGCSSGEDQKRTLTGGRVLSGSGCQNNETRTPRFSTAADQKGKGSGSSAAMRRWSAFYASVTDPLE